MMNKLPSFEKFDSGINFKAKEKNTFQTRMYIFPFMVIFLFIILSIRLFQLTVVKGSYYKFISENNRIREIPIEATRGTIKDRKGYTIAYSYAQGEKKIRAYNSGLAVASVIGYRTIASADAIKQDACNERIDSGDKIGAAGIEKVFECQLRGEKGKKLVEVNARGDYLKTLSIQPPIDGLPVVLSLDLELQKKTADLLQGKKGSLIVSKPQTGEILAMGSSPTFDPSMFETQNNEVITSYFTSPDQPLFNRATHGVYPPGSVLKPMLAAGGLQDHVIDQNYIVEDNGFIKAGPAIFHNWYYLEYGRTEGPVNVVKALQRSNDIFFYKLGQKLGEEGIKKWANKFGFGKKTGISIGDVDGLIPSPFWKKEQINEQWYLGDTYNLSIGQGYILSTPLQVNFATIPFANNGIYCKPSLLKIDKTDNPGIKPKCKNLALSTETLTLVREGMKEACSPGGTGYPLFDFKAKINGVEQPISVGCKTGTAESHGEDAEPHAWFTAFAPFDKPEIVVTVMIEKGGQGSEIAAPLAKEIFKTYFERTN